MSRGYRHDECIFYVNEFRTSESTVLLDHVLFFINKRNPTLSRVSVSFKKKFAILIQSFKRRYLQATYPLFQMKFLLWDFTWFGVRVCFYFSWSDIIRFIIINSSLGAVAPIRPLYLSLRMGYLCMELSSRTSLRPGTIGSCNCKLHITTVPVLSLNSPSMYRRH